MKALKRDLLSITKGLKALTVKTEKMAKQIDKLEKVAAPQKAKPKAKVTKKPATKKALARRPAQLTASEAVFNVIKKSRKGVDSTIIKKATGFNSQKIRDNIYKLRKRGRITSPRKGFYVPK
jgi:hypothetical protein